MNKKAITLIFILSTTLALCACNRDNTKFSNNDSVLISEPQEAESNQSVEEQPAENKPFEEEIDPATIDDDPAHFIIEDGVLLGYTGPGGYVVVPEGVTEIADGEASLEEGYVGVFSAVSCQDITGVKLPDSLVRIGNYAFTYARITSITIPEGVTSIGRLAFCGCRRLSNVTLPTSLRTIEDEAFDGGNSLTDLILPEGLTTIGTAAIGGGYLTSVTIPKTVTNIDGIPFGGNRLYNVFVDEDNLNYVSADGVLFNKDQTELIFFPPQKEIESYTVPNSVIRIGSSAFSQQGNLRNVTLPEGLLSIGTQAFAGCKNLTEIRIPASVNNIGGFIFSSDTIIYYGGDQESWDAATKENNPYGVVAEAIYYNS